jgi:hypothetical protein
MTVEERQRFDALYSRYSLGDIRQVFGSDPEKNGAFRIAA